MVGLLDVLEARNHERDKLRKECGLEIFGDACSVVWLGKPGSSSGLEPHQLIGKQSILSNHVVPCGAVKI